MMCNILYGFFFKNFIIGKLEFCYLKGGLLLLRRFDRN